MKIKMKKNIFMLAGTIFCFALSFIFTSCPSVNGLHNQNGSKVSFVFTGFPENISGEYSIPGDFNGDSAWENSISNIDVSMKNGEGTSNEFNVTSSWIKFTLIKTNDSSWNRPWYPDVKGNVEDTGTAGNPLQNFYIEGLEPGNGDFSIVIDGSSGTAVLSVE